jgi:hypothetical protein
MLSVILLEYALVIRNSSITTTAAIPALLCAMAVLPHQPAIRMDVSPTQCLTQAQIHAAAKTITSSLEMSALHVVHFARNALPLLQAAARNA